MHASHSEVPDFKALAFGMGPYMPPSVRRKVYMILRKKLIGPLFLYHPESEFSAVLVLVNSRLAANSQAISCGVLSP